MIKKMIVTTVAALTLATGAQAHGSGRTDDPEYVKEINDYVDQHATPVPTATPMIDMTQQAAEDGKQAGELAATKEIKAGNFSTIIKQCPISVKALTKKYGSKEAAFAYIGEWGGSFAGTKGRLIDDEAGPQPKDITENWCSTAEVCIKKQLNNPDSLKWTHDGVFGTYPEFTTPVPFRYEGKWAWKMQMPFRAQNGFGAIITSYATLIVRKGELVTFAIAN
jgi:hypothetical protein